LYFSQGSQGGNTLWSLGARTDMGLMSWHYSGDYNTNVFTADNGDDIFPQDEWHHIAATWDGTDFKFFYDGVERFSAARANGFNTNVDANAYYGGWIDADGWSGNSACNVGGHPNGAQCHFIGQGKELRIYDTGLPASDITAIMSLGI